MNWFEADAGKLTSGGGEFPALAERAGSIHRELSDTLGAIGPCWGNDAVGQSFASTHVAPADATLGRLGALSDQLGDVGTRFAGTGAAYHDLDTGGAHHLDAVDDV